MPCDLRRIRHLLLDMDGTIYRGSTLFDCTLSFLDILKRLGIGRTFVTNNSSRSVGDYVEKLRCLGIPAISNDIYTSTDAVVEYLRTAMPKVRRLWLLGTSSMARHFEEAGYVIDDNEPEAVVVGFDTGLTYDRLCRTAWWIQQGCPFLASHPDRVCPTDQPTVLVDCGAISACLSEATGTKPIVPGKPDPRMLDGVCRRHGLRPDELAVVGDRLYTDIVMAQRAGAMSILVLTGEATAKEAALLDPPPDIILQDIGVLGEMLVNIHGTQEVL
ncbi:MAG: HAD-IIA family hydrolase [Pirellulales bacterium]|nr:HAD-IIA family hydrolase [Pirellulales bacterium]